MTPEAPETRTAVRPGRRRWLWSLALLPIAAVVGAATWLTEPLEPSAQPTRAESPAPAVAEPATAPAPTAKPGWPEARLDGEAAKRLLLDLLRADREALRKIPGYTATFRKLERIRGKLGKRQTLALKVRHAPFAVYLKYLAPKAGKEAVYVEGRHDNHVIAHDVGWARRLVPRLKVAPDSALALADNRHPITEAGLLNLVDKLIGFRELDLKDAEAVTILDRTADEDGRRWLRSIHTHPNFDPARPFARVEVLYDPETMLPMRIANYDWPGPDHEGSLDLAEHYAYDDLDLDAPLTDLDFDPANPSYAFRRY